MEDTLISFDTAKLAKEKGIDLYPFSIEGYVIEEFWNYKIGDNFCLILESEHLIYDDDIKKIAFACSQSLFQKYLREKHNIHIEIHVYPHLKSGIYITYIHDKSGYEKTEFNFKTYEEALEFGLLDALKLIDDK